MKRILLGISILSLLVFACKKESVINPYEEIVIVDNDNPTVDDLPVGNFAWLHSRIFKPTCANSGCHDGTFEPEFNTIASSYNTLVNHAVIANDASNTYNYRVVPGNSDLSLLMARLTTFIPNTSGIMPLTTEPDSDWPPNSDSYIAAIESWITAGAPDMFGNVAPGASGDFPPQVTGFAAFPNGNTTTPYEREGDEEGITPILVDNGLVDLWFLVSDDNTAPADLTSTVAKVSSSQSDFVAADEYSITVNSAITALDFTDSPASFIHQATIDLTTATTGDVFYVRTYWDDGVQESLTEVPSDGSSGFVSALFVLKIL